MRGDTYRMWQHWQQMHYPLRGLPHDEARRAELTSLDGVAAMALDRYFLRGKRSKALDAEARASLDHCHRELTILSRGLHADAGRYFGRLQQLLELVLIEANAGGPVVDRLSAAPARHRAREG